VAVLVVLVAMALVVALAGSATGRVALDQVASVMGLALGAHFCNHRFHCTS